MDEQRYFNNYAPTNKSPCMKMKSLLSGVALIGLLLQQTLVASSPVPLQTIPHYFQRNQITRHSLQSSEVQRELAPLVSKGAVIFGPSSAAYPNATSRWVTYAKPNIQVVIQPAEESDVAKIVSNMIRSLTCLVTNKTSTG